MSHWSLCLSRHFLSPPDDKLHTPTRLFPKRVPVSGLTRTDLTSDEGKTKKTGGRGGGGGGGGGG